MRLCQLHHHQHPIKPYTSLKAHAQLLYLPCTYLPGSDIQACTAHLKCTAFHTHSCTFQVLYGQSYSRISRTMHNRNALLFIHTERISYSSIGTGYIDKTAYLPAITPPYTHRQTVRMRPDKLRPVDESITIVLHSSALSFRYVHRQI